MSGALTLLEGEGSAGGGGGGGSGGTLGALSWNNIRTTGGVTYGQTNSQTITGITGALGITATATATGAAGTLYRVKDGNQVANSGVFSVVAGDTLAWGMGNSHGAAIKGLVTVKRTDTSAVIGTFHYLVSGSGSGP